MEVSVCIPYGYRSDWEAILLETVSARWRHYFPEWEVSVGSSEADPFNRSEARNKAAAATSGDILVFCDADSTFAFPEEIEAAVELASSEEPRWSSCKLYFMATQKWTEALLIGESEDDPVETEKVLSAVPGGILVIPRQMFDAVGGFDEGFVGWGYEDSAFLAAMSGMFGRGAFWGDVIHLWHPKNRLDRQGQPWFSHNRRRYNQWHEAAMKGGDELSRFMKKLQSDP